jgi:hypothetical protein
VGGWGVTNAFCQCTQKHLSVPSGVFLTHFVSHPLVPTIVHEMPDKHTCEFGGSLRPEVRAPVYHSVGAYVYIFHSTYVQPTIHHPLYTAYYLPTYLPTHPTTYLPT